MTGAQAYRAFQIAFNVTIVGALLGWILAYSNAEGQADQCLRTSNGLLASNQLRVNELQERTEKFRARQESLQARMKKP